MQAILLVILSVYSLEHSCSPGQNFRESQCIYAFNCKLLGVETNKANCEPNKLKQNDSKIGVTLLLISEDLASSLINFDLDPLPMIQNLSLIHI